MEILQIDPQIDLKQCLLWQYNNAPALRALLLQKEDWYKAHQQEFWEYWYNNVFNLETADNFGLQVWGEILDFPRQVRSVDGQLHVLTKEQYRAVLKGQMLKFNMGASAPDINKWLKVVFGSRGKVYCLDNLNMSAVPFVFEQAPSDEILWLLANVDFLPRPAGVGYEVRIVGADIFGFNGNGMQTFNNGTFYKDYNENLDILKDKNQLTISAPQGAEVTINGIAGSYQSMTKGTEYIYTVSREGFISLEGSGTLTDDTNINIAEIVISPTAQDATITLNGQVDKKGAYFISRQIFSYSFSVSAVGYITQQGEGSINTSKDVIVNMPEAVYDLTIPNIAGPKNGDIQIINAPYEGNYTITLNAEGGKTPANSTLGWLYPKYDDSGPDSYGSGVANGGISVIKAYLKAGTAMRFVQIGGDFYVNSHGGAGIALYIGEELVAVSGGGACGFGVGGGGGYVGGYQYAEFIQKQARNGSSIDFEIPDDKNANKQYNIGAAGGFRSYSAHSWSFQVYGGSSYANPKYEITQTPGGSTTTGNATLGNFGEGSILINYTGRN